MPYKDTNTVLINEAFYHVSVYIYDYCISDVFLGFVIITYYPYDHWCIVPMTNRITVITWKMLKLKIYL